MEPTASSEGSPTVGQQSSVSFTAKILMGWCAPLGNPVCDPQRRQYDKAHLTAWKTTCWGSMWGRHGTWRWGSAEAVDVVINGRFLRFAVSETEWAAVFQRLKISGSQIYECKRYIWSIKGWLKYWNVKHHKALMLYSELPDWPKEPV